MKIFEVGERAKAGNAMARFLIGTEREMPLQFGVAAGRAVGNAVRRNRCKRLLREAVRLQKAECIDRLAAVHCSADVMFIWADVRDSIVPSNMITLAAILHPVEKLLNVVAEAAERSVYNNERA